MLTSRRVRTARVSSLVGALLLIGASRAAAGPAESADSAGTFARLEVQALPDCTTREELAARVAARSRRIHFDDRGAVGPTVRAAIIPSPRGGAVGELVIVQPNGKSSSRRLSAGSCAEATNAIALIIALTLDPRSASALPAAGRPDATGPPPTPTSAPQTGPTPAPPAGNGPSRAPGGAPTARPTAPALSTEAPTRPGREAPPTRPADREPSVVVSPPVASQARFGGGAAAQELFGVVPGALPGVGFYFIAALDREALWSPALVITGTHAWSSGLAETGGMAAFTLDAVTLDACALRLHLTQLEARACGTALYGQLGATGSDTYSPTRSTRPFAAAGGALLLSWQLGRSFELSGRFGASASLIRDSFAFTPNVFHRTAAVTIAAGLGLGVRFP
jgi:hypothetical protein